MRSVELSDGSGGRLWWKVALFVTINAVVFVLLHWVDRPAYEVVVTHDASEKDWHRMFRAAGSFWPWLMVALSFLLLDWRLGDGGERHRSFTRAVMLFVPAAAAGGLAELMKILIRRERPRVGAGEYVFRSWGELFEGGGMGLPSSHTAVAFGAATILSYMYPRAIPVWAAVAVGCGVVRVLNHAHSHFVTDVYLGAVVGVTVGWLFWRWHLHNQRRGGLDG